MAQYLSPLSGRQWGDANGNPYSGAKLFTYAAGTTTKVTTTKDQAGASNHANPIILNTKGEPADGSGVTYPIWQSGGTEVKYVLAPSDDTDPPVSPYWTIDDVPGINDATTTSDQWELGPTPTYVSSTSFTLVGDQTSTFHVGRRIKTTNSGGTVYSTITDSAYTTLTTVTVVNDSGSLDSGISDVSYGLISSDNSSLPGYIKHALTFTQASPFIFEGSTADAFETTVAITDPTADRTITLPDYTGTVSLANPITGHADNYKSIPNATNPTYQIDITADSIVVENASGVALKISTWSATLDLTASGANGLDTGSEANDTFYYVWAIYDGTNKKFLFSTSTSSPTLPSGYTFKARVDARRNEGADLLKQYTVGKWTYYSSKQQVLSSGSQTNETAVTITSFVPAIAHEFKVDVHGSNGAGAARNLTLRFISGDNFQRITIGASTATDGECQITIPNYSQQLYYLFNGASCTGNIWIQGYSIP